ncbi:MAG TPA: phospholipid carrier-dependent glycosyltransferase, partial [Bacteroides sp.]|nr:phospholipid carrier-dependent glycosyltransferase [Bacteroides sp.]
MENMFLGMLIVLVCLAGYLFAFRLFGRNRIRSALILLMGCGMLLRVYTASDPFLHKWDERYHALVAKNLMQHPLKPTLYDTPLLEYDYMNWGGGHVWLHKQPLPLWTMAASMSLFGTSEFALRLPSILLTTLGIWITFAIGRILFNRRTGFIAAFLYSIHGLIIELAAGRVATDHVDVYFLFFIQLAILFAILFAGNKNIWMNILCGISMGLAVLSKWLPALIVIPIWLLMVVDSGRFTLREILMYFSLLCIVAVAVFLPWQ